jgi:hypothetical protein
MIPLALIVIFSAQARGATVIGLSDYLVNVDGATGNASLPGVNATLFNLGSGLGTLTMTVTGAGPHYLGFFVDHEIDVNTNGFSNETGILHGTVAGGQSWEIDEPGYVNGDIYINIGHGALDNGIGISVFGNTTFPDDVSMALGWNFNLAAGQTATASFLVSQSAPSGFFLEQHDPDSDASIYFSSSLSKRGGGTPSVPDGGTTFSLLFVSMAGLGILRRRFMPLRR